MAINCATAKRLTKHVDIRKNEQLRVTRFDLNRVLLPADKGVTTVVPRECEKQTGFRGTFQKKNGAGITTGNKPSFVMRTVRYEGGFARSVFWFVRYIIAADAETRVRLARWPTIAIPSDTTTARQVPTALAAAMVYS